MIDNPWAKSNHVNDNENDDDVVFSPPTRRKCLVGGFLVVPPTRRKLRKCFSATNIAKIIKFINIKKTN
jgi:hypothetical protein